MGVLFRRLKENAGWVFSHARKRWMSLELAGSVAEVATALDAGLDAGLRHQLPWTNDMPAFVGTVDGGTVYGTRQQALVQARVYRPYAAPGRPYAMEPVLVGYVTEGNDAGTSALRFAVRQGEAMLGTAYAAIASVLLVLSAFVGILANGEAGLVLLGVAAAFAFLFWIESFSAKWAADGERLLRDWVLEEVAPFQE